MTGEVIMTDNFLQKLEEKITILLAELEDLRFEVQQLQQENADLKVEKLNYTKRLQELIALLDSIDDVVPDESTALSRDMYALEAM